MSIDDFDPLNKDERLLASKLGFSKRDFAPSASVEESIRAEARRAEPHSPSRMRAATGWLKYGGIAAACVLAFGVAWKTMRTPNPNEIDAMRAPVATGVEAQTQATDTAEAEPLAAESSNDDAPDAVIEPPAIIRSEALEPPVATSARPAPAMETTSSPAPSEIPAPATGARTQMEPATAVSPDAQTAAATSKQRALPTAAPSATDVQDSARRANEAAANTSRSTPSKAAAAAPVQEVVNPPAPTPVAAAPAAADAAGVIENGYDARPPKTTDAQDVQQAWLKRIRALALAGKQEEAAASLDAWHKRYPDTPIPTDLLPLRKVTPSP